MKSRQQKQIEAVQRNLKHISHYLAPALKQEDWNERIELVKHKLGIPKQNKTHDLFINSLLSEAEAKGVA